MCIVFIRAQGKHFSQHVHSSPLLSLMAAACEHRRAQITMALSDFLRGKHTGEMGISSKKYGKIYSIQCSWGIELAQDKYAVVYRFLRDRNER